MNVGAVLLSMLFVVLARPKVLFGPDAKPAFYWTQLSKTPLHEGPTNLAHFESDLRRKYYVTAAFGLLSYVVAVVL